MSLRDPAPLRVWGLVAHCFRVQGCRVLGFRVQDVGRRMLGINRLCLGLVWAL